MAPELAWRPLWLVVGRRWWLVLLSEPGLSVSRLRHGGLLRGRVRRAGVRGVSTVSAQLLTLWVIRAGRAVHVQPVLLLRLPAGLLSVCAELHLSLAGGVAAAAALLSRAAAARRPRAGRSRRRARRAGAPGASRRRRSRPSGPSPSRRPSDRSAG